MAGPLVSCPVLTPHQCPRTVAVFLALCRWVPWVKSKTVLVRCNNMTVLTYVNKGGGEPGAPAYAETPEVVQGSGYQASGLPHTEIGRLGRLSLSPGEALR